MQGQPHVLLVVVDSARVDRVSAYGHERATTPNVDALAERATRYENAFAPAPWTLPSHWSMFTGRFPSEHGVTNGFTDDGLYRPDHVSTVPERLSERGYRTAGFSNNPWVGQLSGLDRGFDTFVEWDLEQSRSDGTATRTRDDLYSRGHWLLGRAAKQPQALLKRRFFTSNLVERAGRWIAETADDETPTFTFLNLMEAHSPYYPPRRAFRRLGLSPPGPLESRLLNVRLLAYVMGKAELSPEQRERVLEFYDASLRYQDEQVGSLLEVLSRQDLFDDTLVVVCADHGKTLGDFDRDAAFPHYLRDVNTNVPLLVKPPGGGGPDTVERPYELADLSELVTSGGTPDTLVPDRQYALVEDHLPHTGRSPTDVTQWHALSDRTHTYVRDQTGEEFLVRRDGTRVEDPHCHDELSGALDERLDRLSPHEATQGQTSDAVGATVEGQLEDLGYLD